MVKLPDLEFREVERLVEALEHYAAFSNATQSADAPEYARLGEMLDRRLRAQRGRSILNELAPVADEVSHRHAPCPPINQRHAELPPGNYFDVFENSPSSPPSAPPLFLERSPPPPSCSASCVMPLPKGVLVGTGLPSIKDLCTAS